MEAVERSSTANSYSTFCSVLYHLKLLLLSAKDANNQATLQETTQESDPSTALPHTRRPNSHLSRAEKDAEVVEAS